MERLKMEEERKSDAPNELDSSTGGELQPADKKEKEPERADLEAGISHPENAAEKETTAALPSDPIEADENQGLPEVHAKNEEKKGEEKKQTDVEDGKDKEPTQDPLNEEKPQKPAKKIASAQLIVSVLLVVAVFSGFFVFDNKSKPRAVKKEKLKVSDNRRVPLNHQPKNQSIDQAASDNILDAKIAEISALRDTLLHKQEEILELKRDYQKGIDELQKEISDEMQKEGVTTFSQAMENRRIEFGIQTIQRRQIYIRKLERPLNWIFEACEDLLYIKRQAVVDLQVAEIASGIDLSEHVRQMSAAAEKYKLTADKLAIDLTDAQPEPLEIIWERIEHIRLGNTAAQPHSKNQVIAEQICRGDFERLAELSEISAETAKCITQMQGSGLFLRGLTELTPAAARQLFQWNGSWICLNGLSVLSPRVAHYLFQWDGNWISLNGLTEFPSEIGQALLQWNGNQLELMGLRYTEDFPEKIGIEFLAKWERFGGKLFVPDPVRKKIDAFNREPAGA
jgi:hypothetical protein